MYTNLPTRTILLFEKYILVRTWTLVLVFVLIIIIISVIRNMIMLYYQIAKPDICMLLYANIRFRRYCYTLIYWYHTLLPCIVLFIFNNYFVSSHVAWLSSVDEIYSSHCLLCCLVSLPVNFNISNLVGDWAIFGLHLYNLEYFYYMYFGALVISWACSWSLLTYAGIPQYVSEGHISRYAFMASHTCPWNLEGNSNDLSVCKFTFIEDTYSTFWFPTHVYKNLFCKPKFNNQYLWFDRVFVWKPAL